MDDISIKFDFECGSGEYMHSSDSSIYINLKKEGKLYSHSFFFKVELERQMHELRINIVNAYQSNFKNGWHGYRPFFSIDLQKWDRLSSGSYNNGAFSFSIKKPPQKFFIAWYPPYSFKRYNNFIKSISPNKVFTISSKSSIPCLKIGDFEKPTIIVIARQHPGESMSSFFVEGFLKAINDYREELNCSFLVFPMVNVEGVILGNHRLTGDNIDLNRAWDKQENEQIKIIKKEILNLKQPRLFVDVHGDEISKVNYFYYSKTNFNDDSKRILKPIQDELTEFLFLEKQTYIKRFIKSLIYNRKILFNQGQSATEYIQTTYQIPALTLELSAHILDTDGCQEKGKRLFRGIQKIKWC